jgi:hypothetical protein
MTGITAEASTAAQVAYPAWQHARGVPAGDAAQLGEQAALEAAAPHITAADRDLLADAENVLRSFSLRALAVSPRLKEPYTDDPSQSPWSRTIGPEARRAHDLAVAIRKHLGGERPMATRAITSPLTEAETDVYQAGAAAERERIRSELAADQMADHAPIESAYGLTCRTCVAWQDDEGACEFGIAIPEAWPCRVARVLEQP